MSYVSAIKLIRTDTTLDLSQKAEKRFVCLFVYLFILGRKLNRQNCLLKEVLRERKEKEEKEKKKSN